MVALALVGAVGGGVLGGERWCSCWSLDRTVGTRVAVVVAEVLAVVAAVAALLAVLALLWFVLVEQRHPGFLHYFFVVQHFQRYAATGFNNVQPLWFYPAVLAGFSLPMLPWLLRWRRLPPAGAPALRGLMAATVAGVLLFFSLPQSKLVGYILPAVPALAWLFAEARPEAGAPAWQRRAW